MSRKILVQIEGEEEQGVYEWLLDEGGRCTIPAGTIVTGRRLRPFYGLDRSVRKRLEITGMTHNGVSYKLYTARLLTPEGDFHHEPSLF